MGISWQADLPRLLVLFFAYAIEPIGIGFLVHESASASVALGPALILWIEGLRTCPNCAYADTVTNWFVLGHFMLRL